MMIAQLLSALLAQREAFAREMLRHKSLASLVSMMMIYLQAHLVSHAAPDNIALAPPVHWFNVVRGKIDDDSDPATACRWCPVGTLFANSTTCIQCEPGFYCGGGHESKVNCTAGESDHDLSSSTPCFVCKEGTFCAGGIAPQELCPAG